MKLVDVSGFYTPQGGGVRTYSDAKLRHLARLGIEVVLVAPGAERRTAAVAPNARIEFLEAPRFPLDRRYRYFAPDGGVHRLLDRERPDVIEASSPWRSADIVAEWPGEAVRVLVMHADPLASYAYRWFGLIASEAVIDRSFGWFWRRLREFDRRFDLIVSANGSLSGRLAAGGLRRVATVPMGVERGLFSPGLRDGNLRARLLARCGLGPDAALLLGVGRLAPEKRWPLVIEAAEAAGGRRPVGLVLIGDGRERGRVLRRAAGNPHVVLLSPVRERAAFARLVASADLLVHGCESETFCMAAAEARASGLRIVAPDRGGAAEQALASGGAVFSAGDSQSAARAIERVLAGGPVLAAPPPPRFMDEHFSELAEHYRALTRPGLAA